MSSNTEYTAKDFKSDQYVRWCPGCGDHAVVNTLQKAMAELGIPPHKTAVISGSSYRNGCQNRQSRSHGMANYRRRRLSGYRWEPLYSCLTKKCRS